MAAFLLYLYYGLSALTYLTLLVSLILWLRLLPRIFRQGLRGFADAWLPVQQRSRPFWGIGELLIMFGSMMVIGQLVLLVAIENEWIPRPDPTTGKLESTANGILVGLCASSVASLGAVMITLIWMRNIDREAIRKLGITLDLSAVRLGLKAAVMILPPVLLIAFFADFLRTYEHPVLEALTDLKSPAGFTLIFMGTAILTPFYEEIFFRGLLQGSLQRVADRLRRSGEERASSGRDEENSAADLDSDDAWRPVTYWPLVAVSLVFALLHLGQGAAPIPLFFLSLGLGYLYRQTGSLIPCIVVHMVLNGLTLVIEFIRPTL